MLYTLVHIGAPLALFNRLARWVFIPSLWLMQLGILLLMNIKFEPYLVCYLFWVRWDWLLARTGALLSGVRPAFAGARAEAVSGSTARGCTGARLQPLPQP